MNLVARGQIPQVSAEERRWRQRCRGIVGGLSVLLALPYLVLGPHLILDDWWVLRNQRFGGIWAGAGHGQLLARPGAWLIFNLVFGVIGPHPVALYLLEAALVAIAAQLLFGLMSRFVGLWFGLASTVVWQLLPNHSSLDHWASASNIVVALALLIVGTGLLLDAAEGRRGIAPAVAVLVAGCLCYEAILPMAVILAFGVPCLRGRKLAAPLVVPPIIALGVTGLWMVLHTQRALPKRFADLSLVYVGHFGAGVTSTEGFGNVLGLVALVLIAVAVVRLVRPDWRGGTGVAERMVLAGLVTVGAGTAPFVKFPIAVWGINDRANVVSSVGSACVWVGLGAMLIAWRRIFVSASLVMIAVMLPARLSRDRDWARAGSDAAGLVRSMKVNFGDDHRGVVIGPQAVNRHGVVGLVADWDSSAARELAMGDASLRARITANERQFQEAPEPLRLDLRTGRASRVQGQG